MGEVKPLKNKRYIPDSRACQQSTSTGPEIFILQKSIICWHYPWTLRIKSIGRRGFQLCSREDGGDEFLIPSSSGSGG
jgi:hypothetical protein